MRAYAATPRRPYPERVSIVYNCLTASFACPSTRHAATDGPKDLRPAMNGGRGLPALGILVQPRAAAPSNVRSPSHQSLLSWVDSDIMLAGRSCARISGGGIRAACSGPMRQGRRWSRKSPERRPGQCIGKFSAQRRREDAPGARGVQVRKEMRRTFPGWDASRRSSMTWSGSAAADCPADEGNGSTTLTAAGSETDHGRRAALSH